MKSIRSLTVALILFSTIRSPAADDPWQIPADNASFHIFLLMGQSNMSGFGNLQPGDEQPVPRVLMLPTKGELKWQPARHPLHNRLKSDRFGLGLPFAKNYREQHREVTVGLIPLAWGGSPIARSSKGGQVYADAIRKAKFAAQRGVLKGVLWHQGESDTVNDTRAKGYAVALDKLVTDLRADLGQPDLPFLVGELAQFYGTGSAHNAPDRVERIRIVQDALRGLPSRLPYTACVSSAGLKSPDRHMVHFDRASYTTWGLRYAVAYEGLDKTHAATNADGS